MSFEAALSLSIPELLQVLNKKILLECTRVQEIRLPSGVRSVTTLKAEIECLKIRVNEVLGLIPSLRNLLQPVNRLPPEILSRIAQHVPDAGARDSRSIIPITHVCRYWRESIISTPENWTLICSRSPNLTKLSLERCKAAPLKLSVDMYEVGRKPGYFDIVTPYVQNTKTLRLQVISGTEELEQVLQNFPQSMPYLRSLYLIGRVFDADWDWSRDPCEPLASPLTYLHLEEVPLYPSFLRLGTLRVLALYHGDFNLPFDTLLDFLEGNSSLERATLAIRFARPSLRDSQRRVAIKNRLQCLCISVYDAMGKSPLISNIAVQKGAHLEIALYSPNTGLNYVRSIVSTPHLLNIHSPTFMEYCPDSRRIRLIGPNGSFSLKRLPGTEGPFLEFPLLSLSSVRTFHLVRPQWELEEPTWPPLVFPPFSLPALETFAIKHEANASHLLSRLFSNPAFYPSLRTIAFWDCDLDEGFMEKLTRFACNRKNTASAWLYRVVIVKSTGNLPSLASIDALGKHVPVVDVRVGKELPSDL